MFKPYNRLQRFGILFMSFFGWAIDRTMSRYNASTDFDDYDVGKKCGSFQLKMRSVSKYFWFFIRGHNLLIGTRYYPLW